jgi:hypothetical protein
MSGSEGDRFVVEVQERVVMRLPLLMPAPSELERTGDPEVACVEADDLVAGVKDATVARPRTPEWDRFDVTSWCYTITGRRHSLPVTLINPVFAARPLLGKASHRWERRERLKGACPYRTECAHGAV